MKFNFLPFISTSFKYLFFISIVFSFTLQGGGAPDISPIKNGVIASKFGFRLNPITKEPANHNGVDFRASIGTLVYATGNGTVSVADTSSSNGIYIKIRNSDTYETQFSHLYEMLVKEDDEVKKGQVIGKVGNTGLSTAPHLHYEVIKNGKHVDPALFMPKK